jgi:hypothetical protein
MVSLQVKNDFFKFKHFGQFVNDGGPQGSAREPALFPLYLFLFGILKSLSLRIVATNTAKSFPELQRSLSSSAVKIPGGSPRSPTMRLQPRLRQKRPRIDTSQGG